ncbi:hypothetical protein N7510_003172 [Penicillium lagena]|uniref:uncharacterized protein n=1 Tax=Penicillium lagena TaxID=94218 RepID=UPI00253FC9D9|nr:uncharacterized protein N7510_003172 [Penicillium lagena]KAJ5619188.1 hypothetical protein N7510_003172 [Penicillium lagena]
MPEAPRLPLHARGSWQISLPKTLSVTPSCVDRLTTFEMANDDHEPTLISATTNLHRRQAVEERLPVISSVFRVHYLFRPTRPRNLCPPVIVSALVSDRTHRAEFGFGSAQPPRPTHGFRGTPIPP